MFKKTITYTDFNDNQVTETLYFNLTKAELVEKETGSDGGYANMIKNVVETKDSATIMKVFKDLILSSYGIKSEDGKTFKKSKEIREEFENSAAYSELFMDMCTNSGSAVDFVTHVLPLSDDQRKEVIAKQAETTPLPMNP